MAGRLGACGGGPRTGSGGLDGASAWSMLAPSTLSPAKRKRDRVFRVSLKTDVGPGDARGADGALHAGPWAGPTLAPAPLGTDPPNPSVAGAMHLGGRDLGKGTFNGLSGRCLRSHTPVVAVSRVPGSATRAAGQQQVLSCRHRGHPGRLVSGSCPCPGGRRSVARKAPVTAWPSSRWCPPPR